MEKKEIRKTVESMLCLRKQIRCFDVKKVQIYLILVPDDWRRILYRFFCFHIHALPLLFYFFQVSLVILSQKATDCPSQLGQTTCTLSLNTPSQRCGPSPSACGCDPQREGSGLLCLTLSLHNPTNWCCCKASILPLSCSSMTRYHSSCIDFISELTCPLALWEGWCNGLWVIFQTIYRFTCIITSTQTFQSPLWWSTCSAGLHFNNSR